MSSGTFGDHFRMHPDTPSLSHDQQRLRQQLRRELRARRRALTPTAQAHAARTLCRQLLRLPGLRRGSHLAAYVASDGEIDPAAFLDVILRRGATVWLPVLARRPAASAPGMHFARHPGHTAGARRSPRHHPGRHWQTNAYGLREPRNRTRRAAWQLDAILLPLVGFDARGQRLGMGGGFYDRLLADLDRRPRRPRLIGLAHDLQQVDALPVATWDRPVTLVVTGTRVIRAD